MFSGGMLPAVPTISVTTIGRVARSLTMGEDGYRVDDIDNSGDITSTATSVANAVNVAVTVGGTASTSDAFWDRSTTATAIRNHPPSDTRSRWNPARRDRVGGLARAGM